MVAHVPCALSSSLPQFFYVFFLPLHCARSTSSCFVCVSLSSDECKSPLRVIRFQYHKTNWNLTENTHAPQNPDEIILCVLRCRNVDGVELSRAQYHMMTTKKGSRRNFFVFFLRSLFRDNLEVEQWSGPTRLESVGWIRIGSLSLIKTRTHNSLLANIRTWANFLLQEKSRHDDVYISYEIVYLPFCVSFSLWRYSILFSDRMKNSRMKEEKKNINTQFFCARGTSPFGASCAACPLTLKKCWKKQRDTNNFSHNIIVDNILKTKQHTRSFAAVYSVVCLLFFFFRVRNLFQLNELGGGQDSEPKLSRVVVSVNVELFTAAHTKKKETEEFEEGKKLYILLVRWAHIDGCFFGHTICPIVALEYYFEQRIYTLRARRLESKHWMMRHSTSTSFPSFQHSLPPSQWYTSNALEKRDELALELLLVGGGVWRSKEKVNWFVKFSQELSHSSSSISQLKEEWAMWCWCDDLNSQEFSSRSNVQ